MSSRIEQLIDEIEDYIESCKPKFMSSTEIIVNKDEIDELLRELRMKTPDEIKRYQKIISNKEAILNDAKAKAEALINEATVHTNELINEHEIMQQAYAQANEVVTMVKESSVCSAYGMGELMFAAKNVSGTTLISVGPFVFIALIYFCINFPASKAIEAIERRMRRGDKR